MFGNYLITALRNLERNRLYAAITILGLAVAFAAAILIGQFVRHEFSYDHWVPGYRQVYRIGNVLVQPGQPPNPGDTVPAPLAGQLKAVFPGAAAIARILPGVMPVKHLPDDASSPDPTFAWVDPDFFKVFPLPTLAGDLPSALQAPGTVVITESAARRYFHRDRPLGDTLLVQAAQLSPAGEPQRAPGPGDWRPMRVTAVVKDLPSNTNLASQIFASARSPYSVYAQMDAGPPNLGGPVGYTFVRLRPGVPAAELQRALDVATRPESAMAAKLSPGARWLFRGTPLAEVHLTPDTESGPGAKLTGSRAASYGIAAVGALIVLVAAINFITLMTARAARRGVEVGVRKATGARRRDLMVQFIGETLIQVAVAALVAAALAEMLIKPFGAFVRRDLALDFVGDPVLLAGVAAATLVIGLLASIYPAVVLSSFRPAAVLKGGTIQASGSPRARSALVVVQFAILVGLIVTTATLYRQTQFALSKGLGPANGKLILSVFAPCGGAFPQEVRKLPGVAAVACSSAGAINIPNAQGLMGVKLGGGRSQFFDLDAVDFGFFELYRVQPLAGRLFQADHGEDRLLQDNPNSAAQPTVIINETAARALGFADPRGAIGRPMYWAGFSADATPASKPLPRPSTIVGVVPDMPVTVRTATDPTFYIVMPRQRLGTVSVRLTGQDIPRAVRGIQDAWKRTGDGRPITALFLSQFRLNLYLDLVTQDTTIAICAGLAILIACLGLFGLSAFTTERRTKEIGVRKAMGADTRDVVLLLLWQFTVPVLTASAIAVPIGLWAMSWWLHGFAYHAPLSVWTFVLAPAAAVAIAWLTVSWQSYAVARAKPVAALRYE